MQRRLLQCQRADARLAVPAVPRLVVLHGRREHPALHGQRLLALAVARERQLHVQPRLPGRGQPAVRAVRLALLMQQLAAGQLPGGEPEPAALVVHRELLVQRRALRAVRYVAPCRALFVPYLAPCRALFVQYLAQSRIQYCLSQYRHDVPVEFLDARYVYWSVL